MEITVNQQNYRLAADCSVARMLLTVLQTETSGIAVAVNQTIISKSNWDRHILKQGDQVLLIKATQGG